MFLYFLFYYFEKVNFFNVNGICVKAKEKIIFFNFSFDVYTIVL